MPLGLPTEETPSIGGIKILPKTEYEIKGEKNYHLILQYLKMIII